VPVAGPRKGTGVALLPFYHGLLATWDSIVIGLCGYGSALAYAALQPAIEQNADFMLDAGRFALLATMLSLMISHHRRATFPKDVRAPMALIRRSVNRLATLVCLLLMVGFLTRILIAVPRLWVMLWIGTTFVTSVAGRLLFTWHLDTLLNRGLLCERIAVVGSGEVAESLLQHIRTTRDRHIMVAGVFGDILSGDDETANRSLQRLIEQARQGLVDRVILTLPVASEARMFEVVYKLKAIDIEVAYCPSTIGVNEGSTRLSEVAGAPLVVLTSRPVSHWGAVIKAVEDRVIALAAVVVLFPLMVAVAVAIRLDSPGPVIFRQRRHGWNGSEFQVFKFRTMRWTAGPAASGEFQTRRTDNRITRIGAFLRRSSLDELPQLFNVLNGTMSLVGPRPHPVVMRTEQRLGEEIIAEYSHRHRMKPGITGWAQIKGHRGATETAEQVRKRVEHDIYYIDNWSFLFDIRIILQTPFALLFQRENAF
jgi:Undecaprenyl-phosphate glucose phosphotransferase